MKYLNIILTIVLMTLSPSDGAAQEINGSVTESKPAEVCTPELIADADSAYQQWIDSRYSTNYVYRAEKLIRKIVAICPDAKLNLLVQSRIEFLGEHIADKELLIAKHYLNKYRVNGHGLMGVQPRLRKIVDSVPNYSKSDEVLFLLGESYLLDDKIEMAKETFKSLSNRFPFSEFVKKAEMIINKSNEPDCLF